MTDRISHKLSIKSKLGAEFRRFALTLRKTQKFDEFKSLLENLHGLFEIPFFIYYTDPLHGDLLPINNDDNFALAISLPNLNCLKLHLQTKGESWIQNNGPGKKKNFFENITNNLLPLHSGTLDKNRKLHISFPADFRQVSSIIDVDIVPETCRRVRLVKHGSDKPLGFYIRDGTSLRVTVKGLEKVAGIFISRLVPGGLAESTGLLAVNDEVLEVNGIEVLGKTLDQVTDMMVANSSNLIITIRPANQRNPFHYPKPQPITHTSQPPIQQLTHHNHKLNTTNHAMHHSKSENNLSAHTGGHGSQRSAKQSSQSSNQYINNRADSSHRIPQQTNENTLTSNNQHLQSESINRPSYYLNTFVKLAPGEDTDDDEEDEVKEYTHLTGDQLNSNNKNKIETGKSSH